MDGILQLEYYNQFTSNRLITHQQITTLHTRNISEECCCVGTPNMSIEFFNKTFLWRIGNALGTIYIYIYMHA